MGCANSTNTAVQQLQPEEVNGEDETGSKPDGRGDSAVSKGTTDSGVVMENRQIPVLPGAVPPKLPPLTCVRESEVDRITQDGLRKESSEILEELLTQGIIPVGQNRERSHRAGEAYSIMLDDGEGVRRRPPAKLKSLKAKKEQSVPNLEEIEEKIRLAEERRKSREDMLKTRLRAKSARVRRTAPTSSTEEDENAALSPVELLQHPLTPGPLDPPLSSQTTRREEAEGEEHVREARGDGRECQEEIDRADRRETKMEGGESGESGESRGVAAGKVNEDDDREEEEEELTQVEEFKTDQLLAGLEELEKDESFQPAEDIEEIF